MMEVELLCALCRQCVREPLLLPCCYKAICCVCAKSLTTTSSSSGGDEDKTSVNSETDSGIVIGSRNLNGGPIPIPTPPVLPENSRQIKHVSWLIEDSKLAAKKTVLCPSCCKHLTRLDLAPYPVMARIVARYRGEINYTGSGAPFPPCQICDGPPGDATICCQQCEVSEILLNQNRNQIVFTIFWSMRNQMDVHLVTNQLEK